jgi:hypothetical protein
VRVSSVGALPGGCRRGAVITTTNPVALGNRRKKIRAEGPFSRVAPIQAILNSAQRIARFLPCNSIELLKML